MENVLLVYKFGDQVHKINLSVVHKFDDLSCVYYSFSSNLFIGEGVIAALKSQRNVIAVEEDPILISSIRKKRSVLKIPK